MFHGIERELLNGEAGLFGHQSQLLDHSQLSDQQEFEIRDIWELPPQASAHRERVPQKQLSLLRFFSKLKNFSLKAIASNPEKRFLRPNNKRI